MLHYSSIHRARYTQSDIICLEDGAAAVPKDMNALARQVRRHQSQN